MKRLLLIIIILLIGGFAASRWLAPIPTSSPRIDISKNISPTPVSQGKTISVNGQTMGYAIITARPRQISLLANFDEQKTSEQLMSDHSCHAGTSGGFYDTANRPLGLFSTNGTTLRDISNSTLINGFFGVTQDGVPFISESAATDPRFVLQTGPLLVTGATPRVLTIKNDEPARRMVATVTRDNRIIFIALYLPESVFGGPLLAEVPSYIAAIDKKESLAITGAVNLDGGSASAFHDEKTTLSELTPIGSFFCVKS